MIPLLVTIIKHVASEGRAGGHETAERRTSITKPSPTFARTTYATTGGEKRPFPLTKDGP
jgi:hypothetical protein